MDTRFSLWSLLIWVFVFYIEYALAKVNSTTIFTAFFESFDVNLKPKAEIAFLAVLLFIRISYGLNSMLIVFAIMGFHLIISTHITRLFATKKN